MSKAKRIMVHILFPILMVGVATPLLWFVCSPLLKAAEGTLKKSIVTGAPSYYAEYQQLILEQESNIVEDNNGEIAVPMYGVHYAELVCDDITLRAPIYYGDDEDILQNGIGQYANGVIPGYPGLILLGGHDLTYFERLEQLVVQDIVTISTNYGSFRYQVEKTAIVEADDSSAYRLDGLEEELILYTCYPLSVVSKERSRRYFVYCRRVQEGESYEE